MDHRPNAHATISGNSSRQNAPPCDPTRSFMTTSAPASRSASAHRVAFSRKNGSCVPATRYVRGSGARHHARRFVTAARRGAEDRTVDVRMPKPEGERQLSTRRDAEHRGAFGGQRDAKPRLASIGGRPRRRTSRVPRTAPGQSPVSTHGAAASHRPADVHRRSSWAVRRPPRATRPTARSPDRHRRTRLPRAGPGGRTP